MVFFADDELYKVIQDKIKNDLGQVDLNTSNVNVNLWADEHNIEWQLLFKYI